jgi:hypothetical protein
VLGLPLACKFYRAEHFILLKLGFRAGTKVRQADIYGASFKEDPNS